MTSLLEHYQSEITFAIPTNLDLQAMEFPNVTVLLSGMDDLDFNQLTQHLDYNTEVDYNRFMGDVWVGIVLTLMIVTSIFCMCACFLYHKFRQWKASGELHSFKIYPLKVERVCANRIVCRFVRNSNQRTFIRDFGYKNTGRGHLAMSCYGGQAA